MRWNTERLLLRRLQAGDAQAIVAYRSDPAVARYQSWSTYSIVDADRLIAAQSAVAFNTPGTWVQLALTLRSADGSEDAAEGDGVIVGDCGIHFRSDDPMQAELGITMSREYQSRGFAAEALRRVLQELFGTLGLHRVSATTDAENLAAARLFTRLGFRKEGHFIDHVMFKGAYGSELLFAMLRSEWKARQGDTIDA